MLEHQAEIFGAYGARCSDKLALLEREKLSSHQACRVGPPKDGNQDNHTFRGAVGKGSRKHEEQQVQGYRQDHIGKAHQDVINHPTIEARQRADADAQKNGHQHRGDADQQRYLAARHNASQRITPYSIGAERVDERRWGKSRGHARHVNGIGVDLPEVWTHETQEKQEDQEYGAANGNAVAQKAVEDDTPLAASFLL